MTSGVGRHTKTRTHARESACKLETQRLPASEICSPSLSLTRGIRIATDSCLLVPLVCSSLSRESPSLVALIGGKPASLDGEQDCTVATQMHVALIGYRASGEWNQRTQLQETGRGRQRGTTQRYLPAQWQAQSEAWGPTSLCQVGLGSPDGSGCSLAGQPQPGASAPKVREERLREESRPRRPRSWCPWQHFRPSKGQVEWPYSQGHFRWPGQP